MLVQDHANPNFLKKKCPSEGLGVYIYNLRPLDLIESIMLSLVCMGSYFEVMDKY